MTMRAFTCLANAEGRLVSFEALARFVYGHHSTTASARNRIWQVVHELRSRLEGTGIEIESVRGEGYVLLLPEGLARDEILRLS